ncbi:MAG: hypothetical protein HOV79_22435 [Hamadaea sp.]|nr:hypothetical protein [Hamadaea sp.]
MSTAEEYLTGGLREVTCARCGACVLAKKHSPPHTSVQWTLAAVLSCAEFAPRLAAGEQTALLRGCGHLGESIEQAVHDGRLEVARP